MSAVSRVVIAGAGIGGLTLANALVRPTVPQPLMLAFHRRDLQAALYRALPADTVRFAWAPTASGLGCARSSWAARRRATRATPAFAA